MSAFDAARPRAHPPPAVPSGGAPRRHEPVARFETAAARAVIARCPGIGVQDVVAAVDAAALAAVTSPADPDRPTPTAVAAEYGGACEAALSQGLPTSLTSIVDCTVFGVVVPVLGAAGGAGSSTVAAALADAAAARGVRVLLVDLADPARSGLVAAGTGHGPVLPGAHPSVRVRTGRRGGALTAGLHTHLEVLAPGMVPAPVFFSPTRAGFPPAELTVLDLGHDAWRVGAHPGTGAGAWMRRARPGVCPVLVVRPSRPSLVAAEQVMRRLQRWCAAGVLTPITRLVVLGASRWPRGVAGAAGSLLRHLLAGAVFVPWHRGLARHGLTEHPTPPLVQAAAARVLRGVLAGVAGGGVR